jgi:hypothetical protein
MTRTAPANLSRQTPEKAETASSPPLPEEYEPVSLSPPPPTLTALDEAARRYAEASHSSATRHAYEADWRDLTSWCQLLGAPALPAGRPRALPGAASAQEATLHLLAGGPGLADQLVHDYLVQLLQKGLASATTTADFPPRAP